MNSYFENIVESAIKKKLKSKPVETDLEEVVDEDGVVLNSKIPADVDVKNMTSKSTTDDVVKSARQPATTGLDGTPARRYYGEADMTAQLGYEETMGKDLSYEKAKEYFMKELEFDERDAEDRLKKIGYMKTKQPKNKNKVRLIEEPKEFMEEVLNDILDEKPKKEINPIIKRQLISLRDTLAANGLTINDVLEYLQ